MTKIYFTKEEQEQLKCNPNVQDASEKAIMYTDEFKRHLIVGNAGVQLIVKLEQMVFTRYM
ncbi:hypothetical protein [Niallia endozanthoxylica]|uniref:Uncharacterized protein n=1 Tax=Niallia endozanthoxylica TaxID=2036016 RepID=A0A5J5H4E0_9BACI|nr:hypothetical protein [Niallia endozanthoxylica]KAA9015515.1 hypothetical protein F4V44_22945 [Niallia endozanthoxylica]